MASVDSGVEMGNDSNDSSITQHENLSPYQMSNVSSTMATTTTLTTTTAATTTNSENKANSFHIETGPILSLRSFSFVPVIGTHTRTGGNEISTPTTSTGPVVVYYPKEIKMHENVAYWSSEVVTGRDRRLCNSKPGKIDSHFIRFTRASASKGYHESSKLRCPYSYPTDRLSMSAGVRKYKPNCHGKIKSVCAVRNRHETSKYATLIRYHKFRVAVRRNNIIEMRELLSSGISPNEVDIENGQTALHIATAKGNTEMVQLLLEYGADPNQPDCRGNTPLHTASDTASDTASGTASILRRVSIITLLLKAGADVSSLSKDGYSPLQLAESRLKLVQTFKVKGVEMSIVKQELNDIVNMLLTYLQKQKSSHEKLETLSSFYSRLSLSSTVDQVQDDVKDLLAKLDALNITS